MPESSRKSDFLRSGSFHQNHARARSDQPRRSVAVIPDHFPASQRASHFQASPPSSVIAGNVPPSKPVVTTRPFKACTDASRRAFSASEGSLFVDFPVTASKNALALVPPVAASLSARGKYSMQTTASAPAQAFQENMGRRMMRKAARMTGSATNAKIGRAN